MKPVIILGSGGHARVAVSVLLKLGVEIIGILDPNRPVPGHYLGITILGDDNVIFNYEPGQIEVVNGIGSLPFDKGLRRILADRLFDRGYILKTLLDPQAIVAADSELAAGVQVMAGAVVQAGAKIAFNSIVNSGAIVEHECNIGRHVHIAPGVVLSGEVVVEDDVHIGTGATVIQGVSIGAAAVIGAGSVVTRNVGPRQIVYPPRSHTQDLQ